MPSRVLYPAPQRLLFFTEFASTEICLVNKDILYNEKDHPNSCSHCDMLRL